MGKIASLNMVTKNLADIKLNPKNPRLHSVEQIGKLEKSLETYGFAKGSMVVNKDDYLLAGHGVYEALKAKGYDSADFVQVELAPGKAEAFMIADNKLSDLSMWDDGALSALLAELEEMPDVELEDTGFELDEVGGPNSQLAAMSKQPRLGQKNTVICPECGYEFAPEG